MRLEVMQRDKFTCCHCRETEKTLNVHHIFYTKGAAPWEYELSSLMTLCEDCHAIAEARITTIRVMAGGRSDDLMRGLCHILLAEAALEPFRDPGLMDATGQLFTFLDQYKALKEADGATEELVNSLRSSVCIITLGLLQAINGVSEGF